MKSAAHTLEQHTNSGLFFWLDESGVRLYTIVRSQVKSSYTKGLKQGDHGASYSRLFAEVHFTLDISI